MSRVTLPGLTELRAALRNLPPNLTLEASNIVEFAATSAAAEVRTNYARVSGDLVKGVVVEGRSAGPFVARKIVKSKAPHAWMYENGTQVRHTVKGVNRGVMPPAPPGRAFIPVVIKRRRQMHLGLISLLERNGMKVSGA